MSEKNNVDGKSSKSLANILALIGGAYLSYAIYGLIKGAEVKKKNWPDLFLKYKVFMVLGFVFLIILVLILFVLFCLITNNDFLDVIWPLTERIILMFISALFSSVGIKVQDTS